MNKFEADPTQLLHTRWMFLIPDEQYVSDGPITTNQSRDRLHHVEVIALHSDMATVVTCYSSPMLSWEIPIACFFIRPSAFRYLGTAEDFAWVYKAARAHTTEAFAGSRHANYAIWDGVWIVEFMTPQNVFFEGRPRQIEGTDNVEVLGDSTRWEDLLSRYRPATEAEFRDYRRERVRFIQQWRLMGAPTLEDPPPEPAPLPAPFEGPRPSRYEQLGQDED